jgi:hypothetical protein
MDKKIEEHLLGNSDPFDYVVGPSREEIRSIGRKHGIRFVTSAEGVGEWGERPILGVKNIATRAARRLQHGFIWGFNTVSPREAIGVRFPGLTVSMTGSPSLVSALELNMPKWASQYGDVGVTKRGIVDYLGKFEKHELFSWAKSKTLGYSNWVDVFGSSEKTKLWESKHGQKIENAVFKLNESAQGKGVWFGLENLPSSLRGSKDIIIQPKINILREYGVVHAGGDIVDITHRFGSPELQSFFKKHRLGPIMKFFGVESGLPELLQPVIGREASEVSAYAKKIAQTLHYNVGRLDIARIGPGAEDFTLIEAQRRFGNITLPWVRQKIEYSLTGKIPLELKLMAGAMTAGKIAALVAGIMYFGGRGEKRKGSNDEPINKITGHHQGRMNTVVEQDIRSDFTAGKSYDPKVGSPADWDFVRTHPFTSYIYKTSTKKHDYERDNASGFFISMIDDVVIALAFGAAALGGKVYSGAISRIVTKRSGKSIFKITGHHPGPMNSIVEESVGSAFKAGYSYDLIRIFKMHGRSGAIAAFIAGSLVLGGAKYSEAHNVIPVGAEASITQRASALRAQTDYVASLYDVGAAKRKNASDILYETATHESDLIRYRKQVGGGPAVSIYQIEPATAKYIVDWARNRSKAMSLLTTTSGLTAKRLTSMTQADLADYLVKHDHFAVAIARLKYAQAPGAIPSTMAERAVYWGKYYQTQNKPKLIEKYMIDNKEMAKELEAASVSNVIKKHVAPRAYTQRVVGDLNQAKVMHSVSSKTKKMNVMKKILSRTRM